MKKTITLNEMQMKLLKEFTEKNVTYKKNAEALTAFDPGSQQFNIILDSYHRAWDERAQAACVFANSVESSFVAEQGPQVNPVEIASEEATAV